MFVIKPGFLKLVQFRRERDVKIGEVHQTVRFLPRSLSEKELLSLAINEQERQYIWKGDKSHYKIYDREAYATKALYYKNNSSKYDIVARNKVDLRNFEIRNRNQVCITSSRQEIAVSLFPGEEKIVVLDMIDKTKRSTFSTKTRQKIHEMQGFSVTPHKYYENRESCATKVCRLIRGPEEVDERV